MDARERVGIDRVGCGRREALTVLGQDEQDARISEHLGDVSRDHVEEMREVGRRLGERPHGAREDAQALLGTFDVVPPSHVRILPEGPWMRSGSRSAAGCPSGRVHW
ncbi:MAG TPA: hypothetical protein VII82_09845 [Polyangiaceae bacterium]